MSDNGEPSLCKIGNLEVWKFELWMLPIWKWVLRKYVLRNIDFIGDFIREITGSRYSELIEEKLTFPPNESKKFNLDTRMAKALFDIQK